MSRPRYVVRSIVKRGEVYKTPAYESDDARAVMHHALREMEREDCWQVDVFERIGRRKRRPVFAALRLDDGWHLCDPER